MLSAVFLGVALDVERLGAGMLLSFLFVGPSFLLWFPPGTAFAVFLRVHIGLRSMLSDFVLLVRTVSSVVFLWWAYSAPFGPG